MIPPTIYRRAIDSTFNCVVRTAAGKPCHRGTRCRHEDTATEYAQLLQRDIQRRAENGDLLPPPAADPRRRKKNLKSQIPNLKSGALPNP